MKLKNFNYLIGLLIIFFHLPLVSEDKIDIWNNKKDTAIKTPNLENKVIKENINLKSSQTIQALEKIEIEENSEIQTDEQKVFGY